MIDAGIFPQDIAVIDRSLTAVDRTIVLALLSGEFTIKRYRQKDGKVWLQAENPAYANIMVTEDSEFEVWGVVTRSIRMLL
jgi:DNA polymerase V